MEYEGKFKLFKPENLKTYPVSKRVSKVKIEDFKDISKYRQRNFNVYPGVAAKIRNLGEKLIEFRKNGKPVLIFTGAHLIKNCLGPVLIDLAKRGLVTLIGGNGATLIHDFELALTGRTSEDVESELGKGKFGMAYEFNYINKAIEIGDRNKLGLGETIGKFISNKAFLKMVMNELPDNNRNIVFEHPDISLAANCYQINIPYTVHVGIGVDVIDQHYTFDGRCKGGCSGRDFLILVNEITKFTQGGIIINIGSAVTGPEVILKAVSMAINAGEKPQDFLIADFDIRDDYSKDVSDQCSQHYYFRDQKSLVYRIPKSLGGKGVYIKGDQRSTVPLLYKEILKNLK